jgi:hypothetical protein
MYHKLLGDDLVTKPKREMCEGRCEKDIRNIENMEEM